MSTTKNDNNFKEAIDVITSQATEAQGTAGYTEQAKGVTKQKFLKSHTVDP